MKQVTSTFVGALLALVCLVFLSPGAVEAQQSMTLVDGPRTSFGLGTVWVWLQEDGTYGTRGVVPKLLEQERVIVSVKGGKKGGKKPKVSFNGSVKGGVGMEESLNANLPIHVRLNYNKGDRIQTAPLARTYEIQEEPLPGQAIVVTFRLVGQERVEGERKVMECEHLLNMLGVGDGNGCVLPEGT